MPVKKQKNAGFVKSILPLALVMGLATPAISAIAFWIVMNTGSWWIPLILAYLTLVLLPVAAVIQRKQRMQQRFLTGDEIYYQTYPAARKRDLKRLRKSGDLSEEVIKTVEFYQAQTPKTVYEEPGEGFLLRRTLGVAPFYTGGAMIAALAVYLLACLVRDRYFAGQSDVSQVFTLLSAGMLLAVAVLAFLHKKPLLPRGAATVLLVLQVWGRLILIFEKQRSAADVHLLDCVLCVAVYAVAAFVLLGLARDVPTPAEVAEAQRVLNLELYELGAIDRKTLDYRMKNL